MRKTLYLLLALGGIILVPYLGAWFAFGEAFPSWYFEYPITEPPPVKKADFSWFMFIGVAVLFFAFNLVYFVPRLFGFKKSPPPPRRSASLAKPPAWFWLGLLMWGVTLGFMWAKVSEPKWLLYWADIPLFWGIALVIDGIVYMRTGGKSILSMNPRQLLAIGVASMGGWMLFEYLNFFVESNWIYPAGVLLSDARFLLYAITGSAGLMPMAFELYSLFNTFERFPRRYMNGPKWVFPRWLRMLLLVVAFGGLFVTGFLPDNLFFLLWIAPVTILSVVLVEMDIWTPFRPITKGNWAPFLVFTLVYLVVGFLLEGQNYFSGIHEGDGQIVTFNPSYWVYDVPYVDRYRIFEMPVVGFFGYYPFSVYCWIWWIFVAHILNIPSKLADPAGEDEQ